MVAGGLRYHGMAPLVSHIYELGLMEAIAIPQTECFEGAFPNIMIIYKKPLQCVPCSSRESFSKDFVLVFVPEPEYCLCMANQFSNPYIFNTDRRKKDDLDVATGATYGISLFLGWSRSICNLKTCIT